MAKRSALAQLSLAELQREIRARQRRRPALERRRARVAAKLAAIDAELAVLGGMNSGGKYAGTRRRHKGGLVAYLRKALGGKTMSVGDAAEAVRKLGYTSTAANFRAVVSGILINKKNGFKRVSRGQYRAP